MTLIIQVSKVSVSQQLKGLWNIILNLKCTYGLEEVFNQNFSIRYRTGQSVEEKTKEILTKMQEAINKCKSELQILYHQQLDDAINYLQANLVG